jgi:hypothetical protein
MAQISRLLKSEAPEFEELVPGPPKANNAVRPRGRSGSITGSFSSGDAAPPASTLVVPEVPVAEYKGVAAGMSDEYQPEMLHETSPTAERRSDRSKHSATSVQVQGNFKNVPAKPQGWAPVGWQSTEQDSQPVEAVADMPTTQPVEDQLTQLSLLAEQLRAERSRADRAEAYTRKLESELADARREATEAMVDAARAQAQFEGAQGKIELLEKLLAK